MNEHKHLMISADFLRDIFSTSWYETWMSGLIEDLDMEDKAKITQDPRGVALELDGDICFGSGSVMLKDELKKTLDSASLELMSNPKDFFAKQIG